MREVFFFCPDDASEMKAHVPDEVRPYYLDFENALSERECVRMLKESEARFVPHNGEEIVLNITSDGNVYFNSTAPSPLWKIGNFREDEAGEMVRRILEEDVPALRLARSVSLKKLIRRFGSRRFRSDFQPRRLSDVSAQ